MTNEQREAIEYIQKQIDYFKEQIKFIEAVDCDYYEEEYELYKNRIKQFSTVLSLIKEQQEEIVKYEKIIDKISQNPFNELRVDGIRFCGGDIKQYFERKVEDEK